MMFEPSVPVLMYHHVNYNTEELVTVSPQAFETQIRFITAHYKTLFLDELVEFMRGRLSLPRKTLAITFDDGYLDNWTYAFPILRKYKARATIMVITSRCQPNSSSSEGSAASDFLNWAQMRAMEDSGLVKIESHTHTHLRYNPSILDEQIFSELKRSKEIIERNLNKVCRHIAWPWGRCDDQLAEIARECGYCSALTTQRGPNSVGSDIMKIKRFAIVHLDSDFRNILCLKRKLFIYSTKSLGQIYPRLPTSTRKLRKYLGSKYG